MPISATIDKRNGTTLQNRNAHYVVVASILSYTQLRTQRVELISKCPRFLWCIYSAKCEMLRGQNETEVIIEADVNFFTYLKSQTCSLSCFYWNRVESDNFQALVQHPNDHYRLLYTGPNTKSDVFVLLCARQIRFDTIRVWRHALIRDVTKQSIKWWADNLSISAARTE